MGKLTDNSVDLIITSPPYNKAGYEGFIRKRHEKDSWSKGRNIEYGGEADNDFMIEAEYQEQQIKVLNEMHRILKPTGSIYLQMDTRINHWMRCIMDDIFGYSNFLNEIVWWYKTGGISKTEYCKKHDVILFYAFNTRNTCFLMGLMQ
jgi:site-specific DNA-methyltransferase (adenine-specific)